ncbi:MAG: hypothetical protein A3J47_00480 [Candidatus Yanofskybacteria bacterium RIFCSPHIGHO2_02_FULL_43_22]|uniref:Phosphoribosyl-ATP pyrophosphohydrolase n=1 Tax=Candidatus Yanofskybacteria bacterium RIFCSPHIGHO2_02_FULL_43_22 TaxID=1802681 RepID=A0A1F8FPU8_9BACT|nr:MAG: hypothetical protein A3J47_00480 [Candidatus Yanofskybacteria bacterium RIFCSPHIGHO2_02_FULL_43_22]
MRYDKLVRDKIPEIMRANNGNPIVHIASREELKIKLADKLYEEAKEFLISWNENELADLSEVIRALSEVIGSSPEQVEFERQKKAQERGGFFEGIVLDEA